MQLATRRLQKELSRFAPDDPSMALCVHEDDMFNLRALIIGPEGTPYHGGIFVFSLTVPANYPHAPPKMLILSTNGGSVRFNPNLYSGGKVCVTILNTYGANEWSSAISLSTVMTFVQSMMAEDPFHNEPGFESCKRKKRPVPQAGKKNDNEEDKKLSTEDKIKESMAELDFDINENGSQKCVLYAAKIRHEVLRVAVCLPMAALVKSHGGQLSMSSSDEESTGVSPASASASSSSSSVSTTTRALVKAVGLVRVGLAAVGIGGGAEGMLPTEPQSKKKKSGVKRSRAEAAVNCPPMPEAWTPKIIRHFLKHVDHHIAVCEKMGPVFDGKTFATYPFEYETNTCQGTFDFADIRETLLALKAYWSKHAPEEETAQDGPPKTETAEEPPASATAVAPEAQPVQTAAGETATAAAAPAAATNEVIVIDD